MKVKNKVIQSSTGHLLPNGGVAMLDANNRMVAYVKKSLPIQEGQQNWDWVRKDCQVSIKKSKKRG